MNEEKKLVTKADYDKMAPSNQGFYVYMEGDWPGSELKGLANPYPPETYEFKEWNRGAAYGVQVAQDSEE